MTREMFAKFILFIYFGSAVIRTGDLFIFTFFWECRGNRFLFEIASGVEEGECFFFILLLKSIFFFNGFMFLNYYLWKSGRVRFLRFMATKIFIFFIKGC